MLFLILMNLLLGIALQPGVENARLDLPGHGYSFGGREVEVVLPLHRQEDAAGVLRWRVEMNGAKIATGRALVEHGVARISLPEVRARTELRVHWQLEAGEEPLTEGSEPIVLLPSRVREVLKQRLTGVKLIVVGSEGEVERSGLAALLKSAGAEYRRVDQTAALRMARADLVLVAPDALSDAGQADYALLMNLAQAGCGVLVLPQPPPPPPPPPQSQLFDQASKPLAPEAVPGWHWQKGDPLVRRLLDVLSPEDLHHWQAREELNAQLLQEPSEALAWPGSEAGASPKQPDEETPAVVWCGARGRLLVWQLPLGRLDQDARAAVLLSAAIPEITQPQEPTP